MIFPTASQNSGNNPCEVICIDNASADNSAEVISTHYPGVRLLRQPANLGFAGGVNAGIGSQNCDAEAVNNGDLLHKHRKKYEIAGGRLVGCWGGRKCGVVSIVRGNTYAVWHMICQSGENSP